MLVIPVVAAEGRELELATSPSASTASARTPPTAKTATDLHFGRVRQQVLVAEPASDCPQQVERTVSGNQIEMTGTRQVIGSGPNAAAGLNPKNRVESVEQ